MKLSKTTKRVFIAIVLIGLAVGGWAVWYVFYKPHRNVGAEKAAYTLSATELSGAFKNDTTAQVKYIDKAILINGTVTAVEGTHISFDNIICNMSASETSRLAGIKAGQEIKVQGRLTTYNDLMEEIMLDQCVFK
jgi:protoporphyrinogen oxidase